MVQDTSRVGSRPTLWRKALVVGVFVAAGGGVALFLGEASYFPVFVEWRGAADEGAGDQGREPRPASVGGACPPRSAACTAQCAHGNRGGPPSAGVAPTHAADLT